jgi:methionyl-tRNA formyltransferase
VPGLDPGIHAFLDGSKHVDGRDEPGHDGWDRAEQDSCDQMPLRLIFMGTPDFSVPTLLELAAHGHEIVAVYTRAPKPGGRGMKVLPTPVEREARRLGIPVLLTPSTLKTNEALQGFRAHNADAAVVVAYGMILPQAVLDAPKLGCYNLHASLLPRWRGAAPINRAIMAGDAETGVMVMKMDAGLDTGDVAMAERIAITDAMTAADLHDALSRLGADLMVRAMAALERGALTLTKQGESGVTYAAKIDKAEAKIDWSKPATSVLRHIHGLSPFPGAWSEIAGEDEKARLKILRCEITGGAGAAGTVLDDRLAIACGAGAIRVLELQRAGKAPMKAAEFLRGTPLKAGARLT